eukprot:357218-Chlamydomonas_euryale.AAC.38
MLHMAQPRPLPSPSRGAPTRAALPHRPLPPTHRPFAVELPLSFQTASEWKKAAKPDTSRVDHAASRHSASGWPGTGRALRRGDGTSEGGTTSATGPSSPPAAEAAAAFTTSRASGGVGGSGTGAAGPPPPPLANVGTDVESGVDAEQPMVATAA